MKPLELMQLHDDELTESERAELEAALGAEDAAVLEGLEQLGDVVRALADDSSASADDLADAVMDRIEREAAPERSSGDVVRLPAPARTRPLAGRGTIVAVGLVLAAAAAGILWLRSSAPEPSKPIVVATVVAPKAEVPAPPAPAVETAEEEPSPAASIEAVDFGNSPGSIFMVPAGDDETTPVVWLVDDPASARMEPL